MGYFDAKDIVKQYSNHLALDKVSISVPKGSIYGLLGPNGAGKTTLIRIINQITAPDSGNIMFRGKKLKPEDVANIGYLPEERGLYKKMKVGEQALYLAQLKGLPRQEALKRLKKWFKKFEIEPWWNKKVEELSKGMQQKVQFIVTVLHEPKLLIFDEPFSGFDPINAALLKKEILKIKKKGTTIIFSTHDMASVEELCDHITLIDNARTLIEGPIDEIRNDYSSSRYEIIFEGNVNLLTASLSHYYKIIENQAVNGQTRLTIDLMKDIATNDVLQILLQAGQIRSFNKVIPSMNDIFIKVVEDANVKEK
jgi:ABC-2 type transport system ATP-binding protein